MPIVFSAALGNGKYYIGISRSLNELFAKWRSGFGPWWVREHGREQIKIIELNQDGNEKILRDMVRKYIGIAGSDNVRSSIPGHSSIQSNIHKVLNLVKEEELV
jgi:hypothetical protein